MKSNLLSAVAPPLLNSIALRPNMGVFGRPGAPLPLKVNMAAPGSEREAV